MYIGLLQGIHLKALFALAEMMFNVFIKDYNYMFAKSAELRTIS